MRSESILFVCFWLVHMVTPSCGQTTKEMRQYLLERHNHYRREAAGVYRNYTIANMNMLRWSNHLEREAARLISCRPNRTNFTAMGYSANTGVCRGRGLRPVERLVRRWYSQIDYFQPALLNEDKVTTGACEPWYACSELQKMLNAKHYLLGCAVQEGCYGRRHNAVLLCLYEGGSSLETEFQFKYGPTCSKCEEPNAFCEDGLCAPCSHSDTSLCDCRKTCHKEGVGVGVLNSAACTCSCRYGNGPNCDEPCRSVMAQAGMVDLCRIQETIDCTRFAQWCPHMCTCTPMPGSADEAEDFSVLDWSGGEEYPESEMYLLSV